MRDLNEDFIFTINPCSEFAPCPGDRMWAGTSSQTLRITWEHRALNYNENNLMGEGWDMFINCWIGTDMFIYNLHGCLHEETTLFEQFYCQGIQDVRNEI